MLDKTGGKNSSAHDALPIVCITTSAGTASELKLYPQKVHEVLGGDITADPVALTDADYLAIYEAAYK